MADPINLASVRAAAEAAKSAYQAETLNSGGGGGTFDGMEERVERLEDDLKDARGDLKAIRLDLAEIKGRIVSMPTTWQMLGFIIAVAVAMFTVVRITLPT